MANHCPVCDSSNIEQRVTPKGVQYWHCNDCGSNFKTPIIDPLAYPAITSADTEQVLVPPTP